MLMRTAISGLLVALTCGLLAAQPPGVGPPPGGLPPFGPPDGQPPFGGRGPGGMMGQQRKLVKQFDKDGDGRLNKEEREAARAFLKSHGGGGRRGGPPGGPGGPRGGGFGRGGEAGRPGPHVNGRGFEFPLRTFADQRRKHLLGYKESNPAISSRSPRR